MVLKISGQVKITCLPDNQGAGIFLKNYGLFIKSKGNSM
jgi:hypothetical protein